MLLLKQVSKLPLSFGGASLSGEGGGYGFGPITEDQSIQLLNYAFEKGFRVFDTAPIYGFGLSEKRIGKAFSKNREKVFLVSKCGVTWNENKRVDMTNSPSVATRMLNESLKNLNTDYIDLYMVHWPDAHIDIRETVDVLARAQQQGKIKHIGLCNTHLDDLQKAQEIARIEVVQSEFNYFNSTAKNLSPYLRENKISFMGWGPFDKGILTGRVHPNRKFDSSDMRSKSIFRSRQNLDAKFKEMERIKVECENKNISLLRFALEFPFSFPEVTQIICGAKSKSQLDEILDQISLM